MAQDAKKPGHPDVSRDPDSGFRRNDAFAGMTPAGMTPAGMTPAGMTPAGMTPGVSPPPPIEQQAVEEAKIYALLEAGRLVVGHERGGEWFRLIERDGSVDGPYALTETEKIQSIINQHPEISRNVVITLDPSDIEIKVNVSIDNAIVVTLSGGDSLQLVSDPTVLTNIASDARKVGLVPINIETWLTSLPRYYHRIKRIGGAVVTLVFRENRVEILLSQGQIATAFHQLPLKAEGEAERFESLKKDIANVFDFFEKRYNVKIEHLSSWHAPDQWMKNLSETYGLTLAVGNDDEFYKGLATGGSLSSVEGIRHDQLIRRIGSPFLDQAKKVAALLTKFKTLGAFGALLSLIGIFLIVGTVFEIRQITASTLVKKWDRSRAALNAVSLRSNRLELVRGRVAELRLLINENKQTISLSSVLGDIGRDAQSGVFLTQVGYTKDELTVSGVSTSWDNFLMMMDKMTRNPRFSSVSPADVRRLMTGAVQFQVVVVPRRTRVLNIGGNQK